MSFLRLRLRQIAASALAITALSQPGHAADSSRPSVRMLVPCPIGSPTDVSARDIARWWSENSERRYYVENIPVRTASMSTRGAVEALADADAMLFDLGDCNNQATSE